MPIKENLIKTLSKDPIGRSPDVFRFVEMLNGIEGCFCIALDSKWGSGKTFFVKQVQLVLNAFNPHCETGLTKDEIQSIKSQAPKYYSPKTDIGPQVTVYYDAWANDNTSDPIISLVYEITKSVGEGFKLQEDKGFQRIAAKAASIITLVSGRDANSLVESLKPDNLLHSISEQNSLHDSICHFLDSITEERGNRLTIFIDELDRCKPSYAVQLLERIKHYFTGERITFVFSINCDALQHTIRNHYGSEFDASRYLDRFFDLSMSLPPIDMERFLISINAESGRGIFNDMRRLVIDYYHFEMREIMRYYNLTNIAAGKSLKRYEATWSEEYALEFCWNILLPIALALKMVNHTQFLAFIEGRDSSPLTDIICGNITHAYFQRLLDLGETFGNTNQNDPKSIVLKDRLMEAYNALFSFNHRKYSGREIRVGQLQFGQDTFNRFHKTLSVVSTEAVYE